MKKQKESKPLKELQTRAQVIQVDGKNFVHISEYAKLKKLTQNYLKKKFSKARLNGKGGSIVLKGGTYVEVKESNWEQCTSCKEYKPDVSYRRDPYDADVNNHESYITVCDDCEKEMILDI